MITKQNAIKNAKTSERGCIITGLRVMHGHNVSHSRRRTKRLFMPNMHTKNIFVESLGKLEKVKLSTRGLRTINKYGGLDKFVMNAKNRKLTLSALKLKKQIILKTNAQEAEISL